LIVPEAAIAPHSRYLSFSGAAPVMDWSRDTPHEQRYHCAGGGSHVIDRRDSNRVALPEDRRSHQSAQRHPGHRIGI